jgi:hypothetical protein
MHTFLAIVLLSTLPHAKLQNDGTPIAAGALTDAIDLAILLKDGDERMKLADGCLRQNFKVEGDGGSAELLRILGHTGFSLSKVTMVPPVEDGQAVRFGFEFTNADQLKTVYFETECPTESGAAPAQAD